MTFATADFASVQAEKEKKQGFFSRVLNAMIEARTREADRLIAAQLQAMDDRTLRDLGYDRTETAIVRKDFK